MRFFRGSSRCVGERLDGNTESGTKTNSLPMHPHPGFRFPIRRSAPAHTARHTFSIPELRFRCHPEFSTILPCAFLSVMLVLSKQIMLFPQHPKQIILTPKKQYLTVSISVNWCINSLCRFTRSLYQFCFPEKKTGRFTQVCKSTGFLMEWYCMGMGKILCDYAIFRLGRTP